MAKMHWLNQCGCGASYTKSYNQKMAEQGLESSMSDPKFSISPWLPKTLTFVPYPSPHIPDMGDFFLGYIFIMRFLNACHIQAI